MPEERRLVTVIFADIVGSSGVTSSRDPEVVRRTLGQAFAAMRSVLVDHGGTVEKFIGDAVMAVFGVPAAHDDDAVRAIRAALALRAVVRGATGGADLRLRIGINTGEVVTGDEAIAETLVTGTPVIVASRLQAAAAPDEILVGALTRRLTEDRFEFGPVRSLVAKNLGEVPASAVLGTIGPRPGGAASRFVGRAGELGRLQAAREAVARSRSGARLTVIGPAGIGKTRVARQMDPDGTALWGHCASYAHGDALAPVQEIVRSRAGIAAGASAEIVRGALVRAIARGPDTPDASSVVSRLTTLLSGQPWSAEMSADELQRQLAASVARFLDATSDGSTTTLVIEDVHLAEPDLLDFLDGLRARVRTPLLIVALARSEIFDRAWTWVAGADAILLGPLEATDTETLARSLLGDRASAPILSAILARAGGIPLYVEQVARTVLEGGAPEDIPPTLRGLIAARLDRSGADVRKLLQRGSALGRDFWLDAVPWEGASIGESAAEAEARGLVSILDRPGPSGQPTVRFTHALIRDVVYASTTKTERVRLHAHYAEWLAAHAAKPGTDVAERIPFHAEQAFHFAKEVEDPRTSDLGERAFQALMAATRAARGRADFRAALALSARALDVAARGTISKTWIADALGHHAMIRLRLEPGAEAVAQLDRAIDAAREAHLGEQLVRLLGWRAGIVLAEDVAGARALVDEAVEVARTTGDNELIAYALSRSGMIGEVTGALDDQERVLLESRDLAVRTGARGWLPDTLAELSGNALHRGDPAAAREHAKEAARAAVDGSPLQRFKASVATAWSLLADGAVDEALAEARDAEAIARELGGPWAFALASELSAEALLAVGDVAGARAALVDAVSKLDPTATPAMRGHVARVRALLARVNVLLGESDAARSAASAAADVAPPVDVRATACARWSLAETDAAAGRHDDARVFFGAALETIEPTDYRVLAARIRSAYQAYLTRSGTTPEI